MGTDPFVKTWWFLEAHDGSWLADADHELFTRDPNAALRWPNRTRADYARQGYHNALWLKIKSATEHMWAADASRSDVTASEGEVSPGTNS